MYDHSKVVIKFIEQLNIQNIELKRSHLFFFLPEQSIQNSFDFSWT